MTDALLEQLTVPASAEVRAKFVTVPFPATLAPKFAGYVYRSQDEPLPAVDAVLMMWTAAEKQAVADVFGVPESGWVTYAEDFAAYLPDLTWRSPAKEVQRLAEYAVVTIGTLRVLLIHSQLHLATDSVALPLRRFIAQVIRGTGCKLWIDTGTSGGIGTLVAVGDTVVATNLVFDCTGPFKAEPFAHESFATTADLSNVDWGTAESLMATNAGLVRPQTERALQVHIADVITCDSFLFDMVGDPFGLEKYAGGAALAEEMDCAVLGLVAQDIGSAMPAYCSLRSVSDPQMPGGSIPVEKRAAGVIYVADGFGAQVATTIASWSVLADAAFRKENL